MMARGAFREAVELPASSVRLVVRFNQFERIS